MVLPPLHELDDLTAPSNDVEDEERRVLADLGRLLLIGALNGSRSWRAGVPPPLEEQARLCALAAKAIGAAFDEDAARDDARVDRAPVTGLSPGWREDLLRKIDELEARGPTSRERPRRPLR